MESDIPWQEKYKVFNKDSSDLGWFDYQPLYQHEINRIQTKAVFVEIGTYHGQSAKFMGDQIEASGKSIDFYTVDNKTEHFMKNGKRVKTGSPFGIPDHKFITMINSDSSEASKFFEDKSLDFVFIDGDHTNPKFKEDLVSWDPKIKVGGVIAGHDYLHSADVYHTVNEMYGEENILTIMPGSWYIRK